METVDRLILLVNQGKPLNDLAEVAERLDLQCEVTEGLRSLWVTAMTSVLKHSAVRSGTRPNARLWTALELFDQHISCETGPENLTAVTGLEQRNIQPRQQLPGREGVAVVVNFQVLPKLLPAFGAAESLEDDIFNSVDRAVRAALPNCDKDSALLCHARYGFRRGLSVPVIALGGLTRDEIGWTSLATDPVVVLQWPGKIVLSSGAFKGPPPPPPPPRAPPLPPLYTPSRPTKPLHGHGDLVAKCKEIIKGTFKGSDRRIWTETLERNEGPAQPNGDFKHEYLAPGRSIGQEKVLMKGTFGVYVTNPDNLDKKFGVTACHVTCPMPASTPIPRLSVVSPGGLDLATSIRIALDQFEKMPVKDPSLLKTLVAHWEDRRVGEMVSGKIGVDQKGYREDWALLDVTGQQGSNDEWLDDVRLMRLLEENDLFTGSLDVIGSREPRDEEVVIMNGARTFWTVGKTQSSRITLGYYKRTAQSSDAVKNDAIDVCLHHQIWRMEDLVFGAKSGDCGCAVFAPEGNGLAFVGLLVSLFMEKRPSGTEDLDDFYVRTGLFVPANMLWEQMRVETGKEWDVCRG